MPKRSERPKRPTQKIPKTKTPKVQPESISLMTPKTKDFIQKICYKKTASIDMTTHGFIAESRMGPINVYIKPLRDQIQRIVETDHSTEDKTIIPKKPYLPSSSALPFDPAQQSSIVSSLNKYMRTKLQKKSVVFSL